jgi:(R,R)-butanediol dehydrogenase/meso-butanediol dehydrogenase/diacetyl reductase
MLPASMTCAVWTGANSLEIRTVPAPTKQPGFAIVRVELTGICGTDFSIFHGSHPRAKAPLILGHEITGTVEASSRGGPAPGARVAVQPLISCGACAPCREGQQHVCERLGLFGIDAPGSLAEFVALPVAALIPIRSSVPLVEAALAEPLAVAVHAVQRSGLSGGETVVIFGAGPIGILTALVAENAGAGRILIAEPSEARRIVARSLGFDTVPEGVDASEAVRTYTQQRGADIVFDAAGHPSVAAQLAKVAGVRGTIVLTGVYKEPVEVDLQALTFRENTVVGVRVYTRQNFERSVSLIESGVLKLDRVPVEIFPLNRTRKAFDRAMSASGTLKVFVGADTAGGTGR